MRWYVALAALLSCAPTVEEPPPQEVASRRRIAEGRFGTIGLAGSEDEGGFVVTLRDPDEGGGTLSVFPFAGGEPCEAGRAAGFEALGVGFFEGVLLSREPVRISVRDEVDEGTGPVRWIDARCARTEPVLGEPVREPPLRDLADARVFFAWTVSGDVLRLDLRAGTAETIASGVTSFEPGWEDVETEDGFRPELLLWLVEDGALVLRDARGEERLRTPRTPVTEVSAGCPVYREGGVPLLQGDCPAPQAAFVLEEAIWVYEEGSGATLVRDDACEPSWLPGFAPLLAYLSPCAERRLVLRDLQDGTETTHEPDVAGIRRLPAGEVVYVKGDGPAPGIGTAYFVQEPSGVSLEIAAGVELGSLEPYLLGLLVLANHDGERGDLGVWAPETGFFPAIQDVAEFESNTLLAVLSGFDEGLGTLQVVDVVSGASQVEKGGPALEGTTPILEASDVPRGGFRWSQTAFALDYLEDYDPTLGAGRLRTWIVPDSVEGDGPGGGETPTGEQGFVVDEGVAEWLEIQWPDAGALYVVRGGDREGLWYADWVE